MVDIRETILQSVMDKHVTACIKADASGLIVGTTTVMEKAEELGLKVEFILPEGSEVLDGDTIVRISGNPLQIAKAEEVMIGLMAKPSGIATAAKAFVDAAKGQFRIVSGAWKKMPPATKDMVRKAVTVGGAHFRVCEEPMMYLDKNYVEMFGGIKKCLKSLKEITGYRKVVQLKGKYETGDIVREAWQAVSTGADVLFVDTGRIADVQEINEHVMPLADTFYRQGKINKVEVVFGGGVRLEDVQELKKVKFDALAVGRQIVDAPLLDMRLDVIQPEKREYLHDSKYDLLDKNELKIENIHLEDTNLNDVARTVEDVLGVDRKDVVVIDVRNGVLDLDILQKNVDPHAFVARKRELLDRLSEIPGVHIDETTNVVSNGMFGWIAMDDFTNRQDALEALDRAEIMGREIRKRVAQRVIVFSSGIEVERGEIEDTNTPMLMERLEQEGFKVTKGETLKDDVDLFAGKLRFAIERGFGTIITTGGVGAEDKDCSVEAICKLDPTAATPYLVKVPVGVGRHKKPGIRIGVGMVGGSMMIALPGPNAEVRECMETLVQGLKDGIDKEEMAENIARVLRHRLREKMGYIHHTTDF